MSANFRPVFLTSEEVSECRRLLNRDKETRQLAEISLLEPAAADFKFPSNIPASFHASEAVFADPLTGAPLEYHPGKRGSYPTQDGRILSGPEFDWAWDAITHDRNANAARRCALAGLIDGQPALLDFAKDILLRYADVYPNYPPRGRQSATWGRLFYQALNESVWSLSMLWTAECLWHARQLSSRELEHVRDRLFYPIADLVWGEWYFIHNIRMWHNAAIGCIGLAFDDRLLIRHAIHGDKGFRQQLVDGYRWKDGFSCEGTVGYHAYGLTAMLFLAEAMQRCGYDPYHDPHLLRAILAPFRLSQPDGTPPTLGDMFHATALPTRLYATALRRYPDNPAVQSASALAFRQWMAGMARADFESSVWNNSTAYYFRSEVDWLLNIDRIPKDDSPVYDPATVFPDSGLAALRPAADSYLLLKASAATGSHDHYDRLSLIWWEQGVLWFGDPGTCYYSHPHHENWFRQTAAHNCVLVDGYRQERCAAELFEAEAGSAGGRCRPYPREMPDVLLTRVLHRCGRGWEDEIVMVADRVRTLSVVFHPLAAPRDVPTDGCLTDDSGLRLAGGLISNLREFPAGNSVQELHFEKQDQTLQLALTDSPEGSRVLLGEALQNPQNQLVRTPIVILQAKGRELRIRTRFRMV